MPPRRYGLVTLHPCVLLQPQPQNHLQTSPQAFCSSPCLAQDDEDEDDDDAPRAPVQIPVLGKLVGHLFFKLFKPQESISTVVEVLCTLMTFLFEQKCKRSCGGQHSPCTPIYLLGLVMSPCSWRGCHHHLFLGDMSESDVEPPEDWEFEITSWVNASSTWKIQVWSHPTLLGISPVVSAGGDLCVKREQNKRGCAG